MAAELGARLHIVDVVPPLTDPVQEADRLEREATRLGLPGDPALLRGQPARELLLETLAGNPPPTALPLGRGAAAPPGR